MTLTGLSYHDPVSRFESSFQFRTIVPVPPVFLNHLSGISFFYFIVDSHF
jgi:hypothetical protein